MVSYKTIIAQSWNAGGMDEAIDDAIREGMRHITRYVSPTAVLSNVVTTVLSSRGIRPYPGSPGSIKGVPAAQENCVIAVTVIANYE